MSTLFVLAMACKRTATSDLNHDNWNHEDEPEESGTFAMAPQEILEKRIVRTAKRRLPSSAEVTIYLYAIVD